ncbi:organic cation transporter protein-like isoform X2 [Branchiostoma floridae]|uniref:Organic cation transporter protein-like isoform X2 n=1 Tax=Branchiostoma floridae TaxID=7739 RepID=A0A9J7MMT3_BRAFL|nr:organic cation transporter protein-like isoform X2 [Branchiostoma floridae]
MDYETILKDYIGEFGRFQKITAFCMAVIATPMGFHSLAMAFLAAVPEHHCRLNDVLLPDENSTFWAAYLRRMNGSAPLELDANGEWKYSRCEQFNLTNALSAATDNRTLQHCTDGWVYDRSHYGTSIVAEFDLVCDRAWMREIAHAIFMLGFSFGGIVSGVLSDRFGRRPTLLWCILLQLIFGVASAFSPNYVTFVFTRFFLGVLNVGIYFSAFVLGTEILDQSRRTMFGLSMALFLVLGYIGLGVAAYVIRDWWKLQLAISAPFVVFLSYYWLAPESPRWLMASGKVEETKTTIKRAARMNGVVIPDKVYDLINGNITSDQNTQSTEITGRRLYSILDLVRTPTMRKNTLITAFTWFAINAIYFGLSLGAPELPGDPYLNFILGSCSEIISILLAWSTMDRWGRKPPIIASLILAGVSCGATAAVPKDLWQVSTGLAIVGRFGVSVTYSILPVYSAEVFPTVVRNMGIGTVSMIGRAGGILAPFVALLGKYWAPLPLLTFGVLSFLNGVAILALPETLGVPLPNTLEDAENLKSLGEKNLQNTEKILSEELQKTEKIEIYDKITVL